VFIGVLLMVNSSKRIRICLAASAGGHLTQLLNTREAWSRHDVSVVTTNELMKAILQDLGHVHVVGECNRYYPMRVVKVLMKCIRIARCEKYDIVLSTGAAVGCIMCFLGKLRGAKVIWLDSITNVERMSLSGRMVRHIADLCLVQWPELAEKYDGAEYRGSVI